MNGYTISEIRNSAEVTREQLQPLKARFHNMKRNPHARLRHSLTMLTFQQNLAAEEPMVGSEKRARARQLRREGTVSQRDVLLFVNTGAESKYNSPAVQAIKA